MFIQSSGGLLSGQICQEAGMFLMHPERHPVCNSSRLFWMRWNSVSVSEDKWVRLHARGSLSFAAKCQRVKTVLRNQTFIFDTMMSLTSAMIGPVLWLRSHYAVSSAATLSARLLIQASWQPGAGSVGVCRRSALNQWLLGTFPHS